MINLQNLSKKYITEIKQSVYMISPLESNDLNLFKKSIIDKKLELSQQGKKITIDDLALIRIMSPNDFPLNLEYHTLQDEGKYGEFENPFSYILSLIKYGIDEFKYLDVGCSPREIDITSLRLAYPLFRRTKHFSLNGLVSNVESLLGPIQILNNKEIIIIEPFKNHINDNLVNLNPVDTFFNLENTPMRLGEDIVVIMDINTYQEMIKNPEFFKILSKIRVFLYIPENVKLPQSENLNTQTFITDIVLLYLGFIPQHSVNQLYIESEYYVEQCKIIEDLAYLKLFQDGIDKICRERLNHSYYNIPKEAKERRKKYNDTILDLPGVLHADTEIFAQDAQISLRNMQNILNRYLVYLINDLKLDQILAVKLLQSFSIYLENNYGKSCVTHFYDRDLEDNIIDFLNRIGYKSLLESTNNFNALIKEKIYSKHCVECVRHK